jgi:hypothetical protein
VDHGPLDDALEAGGRLGVFAVVDDEGAELVVHIVGEGGAKRGQVNVAGPHHGGRVLVVDEAEQQMFERSVFVLALVGVGDCAVKGFFELARE